MGKEVVVSVRPAAVAGTFYPLEPGRLRSEVHHLVDSADPSVPDSPLQGLIVPHAGYVYSGPTAGFGYRLLHGKSYARVAMLGPAHFVAFRGLALPGAAAMATPLGEVEVDEAVVANLLASPLVAESREAHRREHSLEVQLPFLQDALPGTPVVPLLTGDVEPAEAAELLDDVLPDGTLLLVSSDLSHYHDAATARRLDAATAAAINRLDFAALDRDSACGRTAVQIALHIAARRGYEVATLDLRNSADTAGSPDRVVGYGAFAIVG